MGSDEYKKNIFEVGKNYLVTSTDAELKKFIKDFLIFGETFPFPKTYKDEMNKYLPFIDLVFYLNDDVVEDKIKKKVGELLAEFQKEYLRKEYLQMGYSSINPNEYFYNLVHVATHLQISGRPFDIIFWYLYNFAFKDKYIGNKDLHLSLLRCISTFPVTSDYEKKSLELCDYNLDYPQYATLSYRWSYEIDHEKAIVWMGRYIQSVDTIKREYNSTGMKFIPYPLIRFFNQPWRSNVLKKNLPFFLNEILPIVIKLNWINEFMDMNILFALDIYETNKSGSHPIYIYINQGKPDEQRLKSEINENVFLLIQEYNNFAMLHADDLSTKKSIFDRPIEDEIAEFALIKKNISRNQRG